MKKIFLILFLLTSAGAFSQSGYYTKLKVRDSLYAPSRINAGAYYLNGVLQTFGGGSGTFDTNAFHHFTGINIFSNGSYFQDSVNITGKFIAKGTEVDSLVATYLRSGTVPMARLSDSVFKLSNLDTSNLPQLSQINTFTNLNYFNRNTLIDTIKSYDPLFAQNLVLTTTGTSDTIVAVRKFSFYDVVTFFMAPIVSAFYKDAGQTIKYILPNSATDTLATISQKQTLANKTISGANNTITNIVCETIHERTYTVFNPADATTYYYGGIGTQGTFSTSASTWQIPITTTGTITKFYFWTRNGTGGDGDPDDTLSVIIRKNNTTDYSVTTGGFKTTTTGGYDKILNTNLSVPVSSTDYICIKIITPTWNTQNPLNMSIGYSITILQ